MENKHTDQQFNITIYTENHVGLLTQIASIFTKRKINIESLNTSPSEVNGIHRFTIVISVTERAASKIVRQIEKLTGVFKAYFHDNHQVIWQEIALYKVATPMVENLLDVERLLRRYGARTVVISKNYIIFEASGHRKETDALIAVLEPIGLIEFVRSARVAIIKNSEGFHSRLREIETLEAVQNHEPEQTIMYG